MTCEDILCALVLKRNAPFGVSEDKMKEVYNKCEKWFTSPYYDQYFDSIDRIYDDVDVDGSYPNDFFCSGDIYDLLRLTEEDLTLLFNLNRLFDSHDATLCDFHNLSLDHIDFDDVLNDGFFERELSTELDLGYLYDFATELQDLDYTKYLEGTNYRYCNHALKHYILDEISYDTFEFYFSQYDWICNNLSFTEVVALENECYDFIEAW